LALPRFAIGGLLSRGWYCRTERSPIENSAALRGEIGPPDGGRDGGRVESNRGEGVRGGSCPSPSTGGSLAFFLKILAGLPRGREGKGKAGLEFKLESKINCLQDLLSWTYQ
jgi:hypothetical protein